MYHTWIILIWTDYEYSDLRQFEKLDVTIRAAAVQNRRRLVKIF